MARAGLDSLDALLHYSAGHFHSRHKRGQTLEATLPDGRSIFIKRDSLTLWKRILADLLQFRKPQPLTVREREAFDRLSQLGLTVPRVIAWGQRRRLGLPHQAAMVMEPLAGRPLSEFVGAGGSPSARREVLRRVGAVIGRLRRAGCHWPDLVPQHIYIDADGRVALLDVERLGRAGRLFRPDRILPLDRFFRLLRESGADDEDVRAVLDGMKE